MSKENTVYSKVIRRLNYALTIKNILEKMDQLFENVMVNQNTSIEAGVSYYIQQSKYKIFLTQNYILVMKVLKNMSMRERDILIDYFYKNKTAQYVADKNGIALRTFFRRINELDKKFNCLYKQFQLEMLDKTEAIQEWI